MDYTPNTSTGSDQYQRRSADNHILEEARQTRIRTGDFGQGFPWTLEDSKAQRAALARLPEPKGFQMLHFTPNDGYFYV